MDSPEQWRWIWLGATAVFAIGEMATPGSFFLAPFAVGALVAALLAFAGVSVTVEWLVFVIVSVIVFALLRPLARRLDRDALDHGVGSRRLIGRQATVLQDIPPGDEIGMVRVDREPWRAQSIDGAPIAAGASVRIADVQGTRVMVTPVDPAVSTPPPALTDPDDHPTPHHPDARRRHPDRAADSPGRHHRPAATRRPARVLRAERHPRPARRRARHRDNARRHRGHRARSAIRCRVRRCPRPRPGARRPRARSRAHDRQRSVPAPRARRRRQRRAPTLSPPSKERPSWPT